MTNIAQQSYSSFPMTFLVVKLKDAGPAATPKLESEMKSVAIPG